MTHFIAGFIVGVFVAFFVAVRFPGVIAKFGGSQSGTPGGGGGSQPK